MSKYAAQIASNLNQIEKLNMRVRAMNATMAKSEAAHLKAHLSVQIEVATMRINNLMFWVKQMMGATA